MSQFDALLDFGDSTPAANGTVQQTDDFDPFASSPTIDMKGTASGDLLGDFSFDSQVSQQSNGTHNNETDVLKGFSSPSNNINPLYDLINSDLEPDTLLTNSTSVPSSNPLYEMSTDFQEPQKPDMASTEPENPMYGYVSSEDNTNGSPSEDLMGTSTTVTSDDSGVTMETAQTSEEELIMVSGEKSVVENGEKLYENISVVNGDASSHQEEVVCDQGEIIHNDVQEEVAPQEDATAEQIVDQQGQEEISQSMDYSGEFEDKQAQEEEEPEETVEEVSVDSFMQNTPSETVDDVVEQEADSSQVEEVAIPQEEEQVIEPVQTDIVETQPEPCEEPQVPEPVAEPETCLEPEPVQAEFEPEQEENVALQEEVEPAKQEAQYVEEEVVQDVQDFAPQVEEEEVVPQPQEEAEEVAPQPIEQIEPQPEEEDVVPQTLEEEVSTQPQVEEVAQTFEEEEVVEEEPSVTEDQQEEIDQETVTEQKGGKTVTTTTQETTKSKQEDSGPVITTTSKSSSEVVENGINDAKESKEEVRFDDMANIKNKFEAGDSQVITSAGKVNVHEEILTVQSGEFENEPEKFEQWQNQTEGGVYENQPQENPDVYKEGNKNVGEELPEVGMAKNVLEKFKKIQEEGYVHSPEKRELTPDRSGKHEYVSEPRSVLEKPKEVVEAGVFESQPAEPEDVIRSSDHLEEALPEEGSAKNLLAKFKKIESEVGNKPPPSPGQRELTPDRNTKGEYVSEPRTQFQQYAGQVESGEFQSQPQDIEGVIKSGNSVEEVLPEKGTALNLVSKFKQYQSESSSPPSPRQKKELTPDRSGKVEYVSEPRGQIEHYEGKSEAGIFESSPVDQPEIIKSGDYQPEPLPEEGYAKNVAAKFKELEKSGGSSPSGTPIRHKEFTPPREDSNRTVAGVLENTPEALDIARETDSRFQEAELPERGMARNMLNKFKEIQANSPTSPRTKKEFTPPPAQGSGVFENKPAPSLEIDVKQAESGILESSPIAREDVAKEDAPREEIVPEQGYAKNMVNRWKQMESESAKSSPSPRYKEFTPPRDNLMSPKSPAGMNSSVNPNDLPGQYQEQVSAGVYENSPEVKEGIFREADTDFEEGLPAKDTTRALLQRFKSIQSQAKEAQETPKPISRKDIKENGDSPIPEPKKKKPSFVPVLDKCAACGKTVYALEKVEVNKSLYHKACVRCSHCKAVVTTKNLSVNEGVIFCIPHFKQLFARRGNYDEGFGRKQYKKKWTEEENGETS